MPIFDQGYQHWQGSLRGHAWRWLAIARHGTRVQARNRIVRFLLLLAWLPALVLVVAVALWGLVEQKSTTVMGLLQTLLPADVLLDPRAFRSAVWTVAYSFFFKIEMFYVMLLVAIAGPGLISRDLRFNALPLYFSRPLTRLDYFLGKLGVIGTLVASIAVGPALIAYLVGVCFSLDLSVVKDTYNLLLGSVAFGLVVTLSVGTLMLALSSLTRRSLYVGIAWAALWIISGSVGSILTEIHRTTARQETHDVELARWVAEHPPPPGVQGRHAGLDRLLGPQPHNPGPVTPAERATADRWNRLYIEASNESWNKVYVNPDDAVSGDWRPMCSYVANLEHIADQLLDTEAAWMTIGKAVQRSRSALEAPPSRAGNERRLANQWVPQYPWTWSAAVLAGLLGLSTWILTLRVKSLDRLR